MTLRYDAHPSGPAAFLGLAQVSATLKLLDSVLKRTATPRPVVLGQQGVSMPPSLRKSQANGPTADYSFGAPTSPGSLTSGQFLQRSATVALANELGLFADAFRPGSSSTNRRL